LGFDGTGNTHILRIRVKLAAGQFAVFNGMFRMHRGGNPRTLTRRGGSVALYNGMCIRGNAATFNQINTDAHKALQGKLVIRLIGGGSWQVRLVCEDRHGVTNQVTNDDSRIERV